MKRTLATPTPWIHGLRNGFIATAFVTGLAATIPVAMAQSTNSPDTYRQLNLFGDVFERVRAEYVEEVSDQDLIEAAINGMLTSSVEPSAFIC